MKYDVWAKEYERQTAFLREYIVTLRQQKKKCRIEKQSEELAERINSLYNMYLECKHTATVLRQRAEREEYYESVSE